MAQARRFEGRSVIVTGAGSGIGEATAMAFAAEGALVTLAELDGAKGEAVRAAIGEQGGTAQFVMTDATDEASVKAMLDAACAAHGPVRHAFNNVGMARPGSLEDMSLEDWNWTVTISLTSAFLAMKHEVPVMKAHGGGTIVNTASMSGRIYTPSAAPSYSAAKAGVIHLSQYASCAYAKDNIRVNSVLPGLTATPVIASMFTAEQQAAIASEHQMIHRAVDPGEIAAAVLFLSSDEAAMITGRGLEVAGGGAHPG
ncbi:SDR family NAD(P)-dependent oxidoreductase [Sphingobium yanoikuyae]|uniref:Short-chain dehydrogenase n=1 Tax=Sphingobium yanoikuyae TaxID=13690 RepID=A0A291N014_SPHYA|nr:SDR family NAD(P)-dependent oxidoreductase [Sphingobium yanoikuyae]ATI80666.1 short-chain dehydrogenase [Sphingobium yanoikuyae]